MWYFFEFHSVLESNDEFFFYIELKFKSKLMNLHQILKVLILIKVNALVHITFSKKLQNIPSYPLILNFFSLLIAALNEQFLISRTLPVILVVYFFFWFYNLLFFWGVYLESIIKSL
jgi:hypothetical protein